MLDDLRRSVVRKLSTPWKILLSPCGGVRFVCAGLLALVSLPLMAPAALAWPQRGPDGETTSPPNVETSDDWNHRLKEKLDSGAAAAPAAPQEYVIGPEDVLDVNVFGATELNREVRVSAGGTISLPLIGNVQAAGLTPRQLEVVLQENLARTYMKDPHVSVFVHEMQSHPVSVVGAVRKPGVYQVRGPKTLLEILSLAEGLTEDAGETVIVMHGAGSTGASAGSELAHDEAARPSPTYEKAQVFVSDPKESASASESVAQVSLKDLLNSDDPRYDPLVYPGDIVKVTQAGIVYVAGEVQRPGGFTLKSNENISVLQALALSGGVTRTAAKSSARIIRTDAQTGARKETQIDLRKIMAGKAPDPMLEAKDIVYVPNSAAKATLSRGVEAAAQTLTGLAIFHW